MSLSKQQKLDMIHDVELRLAKEELAERYLRHINQLEHSDKPLRTLLEIMEGEQQQTHDIETPYIREEISSFEVMEKLQRESGLQSAEDLALMEQWKEAAKTPHRKHGMDSLTQWEHIGIENQAMREGLSNDIDIQEHYENAQSMANDNDIGLGL